MYFNYRMMKKDGQLSIVDVYYNENNVPVAYGDPISLDNLYTKKDSIELLAMILRDIKKSPIITLDDFDFEEDV